MLTLVSIRAFLSVVQHGGIREAARAQAGSQATLSQHIQKLESELGAVLLHRSNAECRPTPDGLRLLPLARALSETADRAQNLFRGTRLRIGASSNIGIYFLPPILRRYRNADDAAELELTIGSNPEVATMLQQGEIDIALTEWWAPTSGFVSSVWHHEPLVCIANAGHPLTSRSSVNATALAGWPMLFGEAGSGTQRVLNANPAFGETAGWRGQTLGSTEAVKQAVIAGLGVSIVLRGCVRHEVESGTLQATPLSPGEFRKPFHVTLAEGLPPDTPARRFADFLNDEGMLDALAA